MDPGYETTPIRTSLVAMQRPYPWSESGENNEVGSLNLPSNARPMLVLQVMDPWDSNFWSSDAASMFEKDHAWRQKFDPHTLGYTIHPQDFEKRIPPHAGYSMEASDHRQAPNLMQARLNPWLNRPEPFHTVEGIDRATSPEFRTGPWRPALAEGSHNTQMAAFVQNSAPGNRPSDRMIDEATAPSEPLGPGYQRFSLGRPTDPMSQDKYWQIRPKVELFQVPGGPSNAYLGQITDSNRPRQAANTVGQDPAACGYQEPVLTRPAPVTFAPPQDHSGSDLSARPTKRPRKGRKLRTMTTEGLESRRRARKLGACLECRKKKIKVCIITQMTQLMLTHL